MRTKKSTSNQLRLYTVRWTQGAGKRPRLEDLEKKLASAPGSPVIHSYSRHEAVFSAEILPHQEQGLYDSVMSVSACKVERDIIPKVGSREHRHQLEMREKSQLINTLKRQLRQVKQTAEHESRQASNVAAVTEAADLRVNSLRESYTAQITALQDERKKLQDLIREQELQLSEQAKQETEHKNGSERAARERDQERTANFIWRLSYNAQISTIEKLRSQIRDLKDDYHTLEEKYDDIETELGAARVEVFDQKRKRTSEVARKDTQIKRLHDRLTEERMRSSRRGRTVKERSKELEHLQNDVIPPLRELVEQLQTRAAASAKQLHKLRGHDALQERYRQALVDMRVMHEQIAELELSVSETETELLETYVKMDELKNAAALNCKVQSTSDSAEPAVAHSPKSLEELCKLTSTLNEDRLYQATSKYDALFPTAISEEQIRGLRSREEHVFTRDLEQNLEPYAVSTADVTVAVHLLKELLEQKELEYQMANAALGATRVSLKRARLDADHTKIEKLDNLCEYANQQRDSLREDQKEIISLLNQIEERDKEYDGAVVTTENIDQSLLGSIFYTENDDCFRIGIVAPQASDLVEHPLVREVLSSTGFALRNRGSSRDIVKHDDQYIFMIQYDKKEDYDEEYVVDASKKHIPLAAYHTLAKSDTGLLGLELNLTYVGKLEDTIWQNEE